MLYLPHSLAGELCVWIKALLMILAWNSPKNVQNNHDSAPLNADNPFIFPLSLTLSVLTGFYCS